MYIEDIERHEHQLKRSELVDTFSFSNGISYGTSMIVGRKWGEVQLYSHVVVVLKHGGAASVTGGDANWLAN
ncbi:MAG: hypothetical protein O3A00_09245 [Planctomycetota bacterium]|nr:hypothetical protein [Planctomycetota bacterium]